jgi:hypothetical protein
MRSGFLDAFIDWTLDEYVPGHASGTRRAAAPVAIAEMPGPEFVHPDDVLDDDAETAHAAAPSPSPSRPPLPQPVFVPAIRRFAPPRRG